VGTVRQSRLNLQARSIGAPTRRAPDLVGAAGERKEVMIELKLAWMLLARTIAN
jgi:hypothetical protein